MICDYPALTGAAGGQYPTHVLTRPSLGTACHLPIGTTWVRIQNVDSASPWYWEVRNTQSHNVPDWDDLYDQFASGCTKYNNDRYLVDCLSYTYGDFMLKLK